MPRGSPTAKYRDRPLPKPEPAPRRPRNLRKMSFWRPDISGRHASRHGVEHGLEDDNYVCKTFRSCILCHLWRRSTENVRLTSKTAPGSSTRTPGYPPAHHIGRADPPADSQRISQYNGMVLRSFELACKCYLCADSH